MTTTTLQDRLTERDLPGAKDLLDRASTTEVTDLLGVSL